MSFWNTLQKKKLRIRFKVLFFIPIFCLSIFLACGTGDNNLPQVTTSAFNLNSKYTNAHNYSSWKNIWKKNSFIIATKDTSINNITNLSSSMRKNIVNSFVDNYLKSNTSYARENLYLAFNRQISMEFMPSFLRENKPDYSYNGVNFIFVTLNNKLEYFIPPIFNLTNPANLVTSVWNILGNIPGVLWVEANLQSELFNESNLTYTLPPEFTGSSIGINMRQIKLDSALLKMASTPVPEPINIAVIDTGVDSLQPDLLNNMFVNPAISTNLAPPYLEDSHGINATLNPEEAIPEHARGSADLGGPGAECNFVYDNEFGMNCGHGTHVAGIIAAKHGGDDLFTMGVCDNCKIISVRVADRLLRNYPNSKRTYEVNGSISDISQIRALNYLLKLKHPKYPDRLAVNVVNLSLGKYFRSKTMEYLVQELQARNVIFVAAAGNKNTDSPSYPADFTDVISVAALDTSTTDTPAKASFSNYGDWIDISAPGVAILSTLPGKADPSRGIKEGNKMEKSGTSQASPFVAGTAAYVWQYFPTASASEIIQIVKNAANSDNFYNLSTNNDVLRRRLPQNKFLHLFGTGMLDAFAALENRHQSKVLNNETQQEIHGCAISNVASKNSQFLSFSNSIFLVINSFFLFKFILFIVGKIHAK